MRRVLFSLTLAILFAGVSVAATRCVDTTETGWAGCDATYVDFATANTAASNGDTFDFDGGTPESPIIHRFSAKVVGRTTSTYTSTRATHPLGAWFVPWTDTTTEGWTITKTAGYNEVYQFSPGKQVYHLGDTPPQPSDWLGRDPATTNNPQTGDLNGMDGYYGWHRDDCDGHFDCHTTLAEALARLDCCPGYWFQDGDSEYNSDNVVYFNPRGTRDGRNLTMQVTDWSVAGSPQTYMDMTVDGITISNLTIGGAWQGDGTRTETGHQGAQAMWFGGDNSSISNIWMIAGFASVRTSLGATNLTIEDSVFTTGLHGAGLGCSSGCTGILLEDLEIIGKRTTTFHWEGPWGTAASPAIFRRLFVRDGETSRRTSRYTFATDAFSAYARTHGASWEDDAKNIIIENSVFINAGSGNLRIKEDANVDNVIIRNNVMKGSLNLGITNGTMPAGSLSLYNNIWINSEPGSEPMGFTNTDNSGVLASGNNMFITISGTNASVNSVTQTPTSLATLQGLGQEINSTQEDWADIATIVRDATVLFDFYPVAGSPLIDAGDNDNCGHTPSDGNCDVGPYELGDDTGPGMATQFIGVRSSGALKRAGRR